jgi:hypothetical protein
MLQVFGLKADAKASTALGSRTMGVTHGQQSNAASSVSFFGDRKPIQAAKRC